MIAWLWLIHTEKLHANSVSLTSYLSIILHPVCYLTLATELWESLEIGLFEFE